MTKIEELRAAYEAATGGEWVLCNDCLHGHPSDENQQDLVCCFDDAGVALTEQDYLNANFITLAHNMMPHLLEAVEALGELRELLAQALDAHIYNEADGDEPAHDCPYVAGLKLADSILEKLS